MPPSRKVTNYAAAFFQVVGTHVRVVRLSTCNAPTSVMAIHCITAVLCPLVGRKHLHRYLSEFDFRFNSRKVTDGERAQSALKGVEGKRLTYKAAGS